MTTIANSPTYGLAALTPLQRIYFGYLADYEGATRYLYEHHLTKFLTWCEFARIDPLTIDRTCVALYVRHLTDSGLRTSSINTAMTPVKGMYRWALLEGFIDRDPVVHVRLPRVVYRSKYPLDREELKRIRGAAKALGGRHWALGEYVQTRRSAPPPARETGRIDATQVITARRAPPRLGRRR